SLGTARHVIVGVVAAGFDTEQFDVQPAVWVPFQIDPNRIDAGNLFTVTGRLTASVGIADANANLAVILATYRRQRPDATSTRTTWSVEPLRDAMVGHVRASLLVLVVAEVALAVWLLVGAMLLIRSSVALRAVDSGFNPVNVI